MLSKSIRITNNGAAICRPSPKRILGDQLTSYNGTTITCDAQGNPLNWRDGMSFSWTGRQLDRITKSDGTVVSFTYDANGMRMEKTVGDETYGYVWQNGKLVAESYEYNPEDTQYYIYDENSSPVAWSYLDEYYYIKNQQGDILGFTDSEGNVVVTYEYDAWGNLISYTGTWYLAEYNSLRYRGYAYDEETGFYYLRSRYYDPFVGRFWNADGLVSTGQGLSGNNMFAYCGNNPVMRADTSGHFWGIVVGIIATVAVGIAVVKKVNKRLKEKNYEHNAKIDNNKDTTTYNKYIYNQKAAPIDSFEFGVSNASGTSCEAIAVHNVKVHHGIESTLTNTIEDIQNNDAMWLLGMWGSNYYTLDTVLEDSGFACTPVGLNEMTTPGTYIISYWDYGPIHTIGVVYDGTNYYAWNTGINWQNNDNSKMDKINPQTDYRWRYLYGYLVE